MKNMMKRKKKRSKKKSRISENFEYVYNSIGRRISWLEMSAEMMCQLYEGQLSKYTNVMKGWQFRWFILDPKTGILSYYLNENERKQQPRGWFHLEAAVIAPSDEDSNTFTVNSSTGESFKLRAQDARARQEWVNRLRAVSQMFSTAAVQNNPQIPTREHIVLSKPPSCMLGPGVQSSASLALWDAFAAVREHLFRAEQNNYLMQRAIDDLPSTGEIKNLDPGLLILKASSQSMLTALNQCLYILHQESANGLASGSIKTKGSIKHDHPQHSHSKKKFQL
ncbi:oxysterol-binding protein-related protein 11 isoform X2 [Rhodnius prolixus]